jgi:hypothetical protein
MFEVTFQNGKYQTVINGKTVRRTNKAHMDYVIKKAMDAAGVTNSVPAKQSRFTINQRFGFVADMVNMLIKGDQPSVVITGPGGLGKSFTVMDALSKKGFKDTTLLDGFEIGALVNRKKTFQVVKGHSTPKGLYRTLFENQEGVIVFDDCDSVLKDPVSLNLLKGALDSYSKRIISWRADMRDEDLPQSFEFKGRVVFISNLSSSTIDQAIITRSMAVDLSMTTEQKVERMQFIAEQDNFLPEYDKSVKTDALQLIADLCDDVKELSLRTLIQVCKIRNSAGANWKDLAEYSICG